MPDTNADVPPDRLSLDPRSDYFDESLLSRGVGIRFNGQEKTNVIEYSVSEGWIRVAAGRSRDRFGQPMTLKLNGKDDNLRRADFQALATTAGLRAGEAEGAVDEVVQRLRGALDGIAVPKAIELSDETQQMKMEVLDLCRRRIEGMA